MIALFGLSSKRITVSFFFTILFLFSCNRTDSSSQVLFRDHKDSSDNGISYINDQSMLVFGKKTDSARSNLILINDKNIMIRNDSESSESDLKGIAITDSAIFLDAGVDRNIVFVGLAEFDSHEQSDHDSSLIPGAAYLLHGDRTLYVKPREGFEKF